MVKKIDPSALKSFSDYGKKQKHKYAKTRALARKKEAKEAGPVAVKKLRAHEKSYKKAGKKLYGA